MPTFPLSPFRAGLGVLGVGLLASAAHADVNLPALFTDGAVLQQKRPDKVWGTADPGEAVTVTFRNQTLKTTAGSDGKWQVTLKPLTAGGPDTLTVQGKNTVTLNNILVGEVWVCSGQSNMEFKLPSAKTGPAAIAASANPNIHLFHVKLTRSDTPLTDVTGSWQVAGPTTTPAFSAVGYFFGRDLQKDLNVPIGLIESDWGGTPAESWTPEEKLDGDTYLNSTYVANYPRAQEGYQKALAAYPDAVQKAKDAGKAAPRKPGAPWRHAELYNAMIAPLTPYSIAGATWYQGESNTGNPTGYLKLLPAMIAGWREAWGEPDFPFLIVQLAPFGAGGNGYAGLRESQSEIVRTTPKTGLAVITDVGVEKNIHPTDKEPVGVRLALQARRVAYSEKIDADGPTLKSVKRDGANVVLRFDNADGGLFARGGISSENPVTEGTLVGFTLAGEDGKMIPATAQITGKDTIVVHADGVTMPTSVGYGYVNFPVVNLWNGMNLPASPFRADVK